MARDRRDTRDYRDQRYGPAGTGGLVLPNLLTSVNISSWFKASSGAAMTVASGQSGPTGLSDAFLLTSGTNETTDASQFNITRLGMDSPSSDTIYTFSIKAKAGTTSHFTIYLSKGATFITSILTLSAAWKTYSVTGTIHSTDTFAPSMGWAFDTQTVSGLTVLVAQPMLNLGSKPALYKAP